MEVATRPSVPTWALVPFFGLMLILGSSFNCVCWEEDEHDWCEEHDCDDDAEGSDDDDSDTAGDDDDTKDKPPTDDDTGDDDATSDDDDAIADDDDATADDDDATADDDDTTADDDDATADDDDTVGDDDDTIGNPFDCTDFCDMEQGICVDWTGSGMTCMDFCLGCLTPQAIDCLATCPADPYTDSCACVYNCISAWITP